MIEVILILLSNKDDTLTKGEKTGEIGNLGFRIWYLGKAKYKIGVGIMRDHDSGITHVKIKRIVARVTEDHDSGMTELEVRQACTRVGLND